MSILFDDKENNFVYTIDYQKTKLSFQFLYKSLSLENTELILNSLWKTKNILQKIK